MKEEFRYVRAIGASYSIQRRVTDAEEWSLQQWHHMYYASGVEEAKKEVKMLRAAAKKDGQK